MYSCFLLIFTLVGINSECIKFTRETPLCNLYLDNDGVYVKDNKTHLSVIENEVLESVFVTHSTQCTPEAINMYCAIHLPPCVNLGGIQAPSKICRTVC